MLLLLVLLDLLVIFIIIGIIHRRYRKSSYEKL